MVKVISVVALTAILPYVSALFIPPTSKGGYESDYEAPIHTSSNAKTIDGQYIVVFHPHTDDGAIAQHHTFLQTTLLAQPPIARSGSSQQPFGWHNPLNDLFGMIKHTYNITNKLKGYSGRFSDGAIDLLRRDPNVAYIERDQEMHIYEQEKNAPWGLARLSHKESLGFSTFNKYDYDARGGLGVTGKFIISTRLTDFQLTLLTQVSISTMKNLKAELFGVLLSRLVMKMRMVMVMEHMLLVPLLQRRMVLQRKPRLLPSRSSVPMEVVPCPMS
jgi:hypothetical protein